MSSTHVYEESGLDFPEDLEQYKPGGFHPLALKQIVGGGRFQIVHKLGSGAIGTVWLVRDLASGATDGSRLFCLKVVQADRSPMCAEDAAEVAIPKALAASSAELRERLLVAIESFLEVGPNGSHLCTISAVAGPSLSSMHECPGRVIGNRRLRAEYSRKIARQVAGFVQGMHSMGYAHGDLKASNVLLRLDPSVSTWSDEKVYEVLGSPFTEKVERLDRQPRDAYAPAELVESIPAIKFMAAGLVRADAVVIDFGQSFAVNAKPHDYEPATGINYRAPETRFEDEFTLATDVWSMGCLLFEIRAGAPLIEAYFPSDASILCQMVNTLGRLPDPWWAAWNERIDSFRDDGEPLDSLDKANIHARLRNIGTRDKKSWELEGPLIENTGTRLAEEEVVLLGDLLEKMLRYRPEERITMDEVVRHPWFAYESNYARLCDQSKATRL